MNPTSAQASRPKLGLRIPGVSFNINSNSNDTTTTTTAPGTPATVAMIKPSLSLRCSTSVATRPSLSILSSPVSPVVSNTDLYQHGFSAFQQPIMYAYANYCTARSILKKKRSTTSISSTSTASPSGDRVRQLAFVETPVVYCVSPIEDDEYYGRHVKMSREERKWLPRQGD